MSYQEILNNAPEGMFTAVYTNYSDKWLYSNQSNLRSLADIQKLVEKGERIEELEKVLKNIVNSEILSRVASSNYHTDAIKALKGGDL